MTTGADLYRVVVEAPHEDAPRLILADWLEENNQAERAEFIRTQIEMEQHRELTPQWIALFRKADKLLSGNFQMWSFPIPQWIQSPVFRRGFVEGGRMTANRFLAEIKACQSVFPLRWVWVENAGPEQAPCHELITCPEMRNLHALSFESWGYPPAHALSEHLELGHGTALRVLELLRGPHVDAQYLTAKHFPNLHTIVCDSSLVPALTFFPGSSTHSVALLQRPGRCVSHACGRCKLSEL